MTAGMESPMLRGTIGASASAWFQARRRALRSKTVLSGALTGLLLDVLATTGTSDQPARVVTVSSQAHRSGTMQLADVSAATGYHPWRAYGRSKLANLLFTYELQRKAQAAGVPLIAVAAHPGYTATELQRHTGIFSFLNHILAQSPPRGALS